MNMKKKVFRNFYQVKAKFWTSLAFQWLGLYTSAAEGTGSIPGQGTQVPPATQLRQNKKKNEKRKKKPRFSQCSEEEKKMRGNEAKSVDIHE